MQGQTWSGPEVQGPREAMCQDATPVRAEAACEVAQVCCPRIPHTLLAHPDTWRKEKSMPVGVVMGGPG